MADLTAVRGDTTVITHTIVDGAGAALDLTGLALEFTARRDGVAGAAVATKSITSGGIVIRSPQSGATKGVCDTTLLPADTSGLPAYRVTLVYDLQHVAGSARYTLESGTIMVSPDVTTS